MNPMGVWADMQGMQAHNFVCGHIGCGHSVASEKGWYSNHPNGQVTGPIYICPLCRRPTFFDRTEGTQIPGVSLGNSVDHLPDDVGALYEEIRKVTSAGAYTSAVMGCRKLLMHVAVEKGADTGESFVKYIDYLQQKHYTPPSSDDWVDSIRKRGNEANHQIVLMKSTDARDLIAFSEMLLKFIYEFPGKMPAKPAAAPAKP